MRCPTHTSFAIVDMSFAIEIFTLDASIDNCRFETGDVISNRVVHSSSCLFHPFYRRLGLPVSRRFVVTFARNILSRDVNYAITRGKVRGHLSALREPTRTLHWILIESVDDAVRRTNRKNDLRGDKQKPKNPDRYRWRASATLVVNTIKTQYK